MRFTFFSLILCETKVDCKLVEVFWPGLFGLWIHWWWVHLSSPGSWLPGYDLITLWTCHSSYCGPGSCHHWYRKRELFLGLAWDLNWQKISGHRASLKKKYFNLFAGWLFFCLIPLWQNTVSTQWSHWNEWGGCVLNSVLMLVWTWP